MRIAIDTDLDVIFGMTFFFGLVLILINFSLAILNYSLDLCLMSSNLSIN
jgi:hypothetical protein